jgi:dihydroorotate dehydrogenase electron transfer subunit
MTSAPLRGPAADQLSLVTDRREIAPGLAVLRFRNAHVAQTTKAGQFVNILPRAGEIDPLLRRPFSVYGIHPNDEASIIVQVHGRGTERIARTQAGDMLDVLGPLGNPWNILSGDYSTAVLVIGGVGVASMPLLTIAIELEELQVAAYYGARSANLLALEGLRNLQIATDDGSSGYHGTNIALLRQHLSEGRIERPKLFVCGPTAMMRAAQSLAMEFGIPCEVSLETEMACGIGICQGCPVETDRATFESTGKRFRLVCTEGPSFPAESIVL